MRLLVIGVAGFLLSATVAATTLEILLRPVDRPANPPSGQAQVKVETVEGEEGAEPILKEMAPPGPIKIDVEPGRIYQLSVTLTGYWAPTRVVRSDQAEQDLTVDLYPTGTLAGRLRVAGGSEPPSRLAVRFSRPPESPFEIPEDQIECPVDAGAFKCPIPAGDLDLRLRSPHHVSQYLWAVKVPVHGLLDLGVLNLQPGASVVGWVTAPTRDFDFGKVEVVTSPRMMGVASGSDLERLETVSQKTGVNSRGFFAVSGLAPGSYVVRVKHPDYATATVAPVTVLDGAETEIKDIELRPPAILETHLWPPRHPLSRWFVSLHRKSPVPGNSDLIDEHAASRDGVWSVSNLEPGDYLLRVEDRRGSTWTLEDIEVSPGMQPIELRLPMIRVEGEVVLGKTPLSAKLYFGGKHGTRSIQIQSDEDGKFYVFLPPRPSWFVDVVSSDPEVDAQVERVEVRRGPEDPWAKMRIIVPDHRLTGEVIDEEGRPVPGATVHAMGASFHEYSTQTEEPEGHFELRGLGSGTWNVEATAAGDGERSSSERLTVEISDDHEPDSVRLVLRKEKRLTGAVVGPDGDGVPGATVFPFPRSNGVRVSDHLSPVTTNVDGVFEISVAAQTEEVLLTVFPPGFDVTEFRVDLQSDEPLWIPVGARGGTLTLRYRGISEDTGGSALRAGTLVFADTSLMFPYALESWAKAHGVPQAADRFVIPDLAPGPYTACLEVGPGPQLTGHPPGDRSQCASGVLAPFGELELTLTPPHKRVQEHSAAN